MKTSPFLSTTLDRLAPYGDVQAKAMFGGHCLYLDGRAFAMVIEKDLYLKGDAETLDAYTAQGMRPFSYEMRGRTATMAYYRVPAKIYQDPELFDRLARLASDASLRAKKKPRK